MLLLLLFLTVYNPEYWQIYPSIERIHSITFGSRELYMGVPGGIYILDRASLRLRRTLTSLDGLQGDVQLCAFLPGRNLLYVSTSGHLYEYLRATDVLLELSPPFTQVKSIGITSEVAWFDTDRGTFRRVRSAQQFEPAQPPATGIRWYGERDTTKPWAYPVLTPHYIVDRQLERYDLTHVWADPEGRRLYATTLGYGVAVFDPHTGFLHRRVAPGPSSNRINRAFLAEGRIWFLGDDRIETIDSLGNWEHTRIGGTRLIPLGSNRILAAISRLRFPSQLTSLISDSTGLLLSSREEIYQLNPSGVLVSLADLLNPESAIRSLGINAIWRHRDSLLIGTDRGLFLSTSDTLMHLADPFGRFDWGVFDILQTSDGDLFFSTLGGIVKMTQADTWAHLIPPGYSLNIPIRRLANGGDYVFFSYGSSIGAYNRRLDSWHTLPPANQLPWSNVQLLHADSNSVWFSAVGFVGRCHFRSVLP